MVVKRGFHLFCERAGVASKINMPSALSGESIVIEEGMLGMVMSLAGTTH